MEPNPHVASTNLIADAVSMRKNILICLKITNKVEVLICRHNFYLRVFVLVNNSIICEPLRLKKDRGHKEFYPVAKKRSLGNWVVVGKGSGTIKHLDFAEEVSRAETPYLYFNMPGAASDSLIISTTDFGREGEQFSISWYDAGGEETEVARFVRGGKGVVPIFGRLLYPAFDEYPVVKERRIHIPELESTHPYCYVPKLDPAELQRAETLVSKSLTRSYNEGDPKIKQGMSRFAAAVLER